MKIEYGKGLSIVDKEAVNQLSAALADERLRGADHRNVEVDFIAAGHVGGSFSVCMVGTANDDRFSYAFVAAHIETCTEMMMKQVRWLNANFKVDDVKP